MPGISLENVSYVPLSALDGLDIGGHSGMILPNSSINFDKRRNRKALLTKKKETCGSESEDGRDSGVFRHTLSKIQVHNTTNARVLSIMNFQFALDSQVT